MIFDLPLEFDIFNFLSIIILNSTFAIKSIQTIHNQCFAYIVMTRLEEDICSTRLYHIRVCIGIYYSSLSIITIFLLYLSFFLFWSIL